MKIKKLLCAILCVCLILPAFFMVGCKDEKPNTRVMEVSLNPEVEFVLDKNNKVISVNALNEDGYAIVSANVDFTNMSAEEATKKFLEIAKDKKFILETSTNEISISISGEDADALLQSVKNNAKQYLNGLNITNITFDLEDIDKEDLVEKVKEAFGEYSQSALNKMSEEELLALIKKSREETKNILNEQAKELYYALREQKVLEAQFKAIADNFSTYFAGFPIDMSSLFTQFSQSFNTNLEQLEQDFAGLQTKLNEYVAAKEAYLQAQANGTLNAIITANYNFAKQAYENMENYIDIFESAMNIALSTIQTSLSMVLNSMPDTLKNAITTAQNNAAEALQNAFAGSGEFANFNISGWNNAN